MTTQPNLMETLIGMTPTNPPTSSSEMSNVFVYGTLKTGYGNNALLRRATFIGRATSLLPSFRMLDGGYPYLFTGGESFVSGELYSVTDPQFRRLDGLEGYPTHYTREVHQFTSELGNVYDAWVYLNPRHDDYVRAESTFYGRQPVIPDETNTLTWERKYAA
jgi:gamma-glutamylcyclotransferase (GGCT)/AIG2-like uncharacterized protein YtfP